MATFPGYEGYGGATITRVVDGAGAEWIGCCAKRNGAFGFYVFKNGANVPISPFCSGRGSIHDNGTWIAWEGSTHFMGAIPGFVPLPVGQPGPPGPSGSGGTVMFDAQLTTPSWEGRTLNGGELIDVPALFGVPVASSYIMRLAVQAPAPDVRLRAGSQIGPAILTVNTQVAHLQIQNQGRVPGPMVYVSTVNGPATCWVQVCGYERA